MTMDITDLFPKRERVLTSAEFWHFVESREDVKVHGMVEAEDPKDDAVIFGLTGIPARTNTGWMIVSMHPTETLFHSLETWTEIFNGERDLKIMKHFTRIVGYYSELNNWNMSKIAELADRRRGHYEL